MEKIKVAIIGLGNCASSLIQGLEYYKDKNEKCAVGLMHWNLGGYLPSDIEVVAAFDVDKRKVGKDISIAIFSEPNCTKRFAEVPFMNVKVLKGPVLDGVSPHMKEYFQIDDKQLENNFDSIVKILKEKKTDILINYTPVGSKEVTMLWTEAALNSGCGLINCIPVFIGSDIIWSNKFKIAKLPIIGDDIKSQVGATIVHRALTKMLIDRGAKIDSTYQINVGGNTDFRNMLDRSRLESKKISKTESIKSLIPDKDTYIYAGPNGCIDCLNDNKICHIRIDFRIFGNIQCGIDLKLSVEDSPNSAGIVIDAIRCAKLALDRNIGGVLYSPSAYFMKHPPKQYTDDEAYNLLENFIEGKIPEEVNYGKIHNANDV